jgi:nicotinate-nucleotide adenylyltransferase
MNIGLFFGSFNPIHTGHLIIANTVCNAFQVDNIWFVVSPQNPLKEKLDLLTAECRLELVKKAIAEDARFTASDVEFKLPVPSYTINTFNHLENTHPDLQFYFILGSDAYASLAKWKDWEALIKKKIIVYQRPGSLVPETSVPANVTVLRSPLLDISSTEIRRLIKTGKSIRYLTPDPVIKAIEKDHFYM